MKLEDYISKKTIRSWLENYEALEANDRPIDQVPGNSRPKDVDGITPHLLNKAMLDKAVENLPVEIRTCVKNRWMYKHGVRYTCRLLRISKDEYYSHCGLGVVLIHNELNGSMYGIKQLMKKIYN